MAPYSYGALDVGGASSQITYSTPANATLSLQLFSREYHLFSDSDLCYGLRETGKKVII